jgi:hypothetical protein
MGFTQENGIKLKMIMSIFVFHFSEIMMLLNIFCHLFYSLNKPKNYGLPFEF